MEIHCITKVEKEFTIYWQEYFRNISRFHSDITEAVLFQLKDKFSYFMPGWAAERDTYIFTATFIVQVQPNGLTVILNQLKSFEHFCN